MINELLLLTRKHTDTFIEQTKTKRLETLNFILNKQMETFFPPINLFEEREWLLTLTSFDATESVFKKTDENSSFSTSTTGHLYFRGRSAFINQMQNLLELRSQNDFQLHVKEVRERGSKKNR